MKTARKYAIVANIFIQTVARRKSMSENETCKYCRKPANWTVYPEGHRKCNHCSYITYPKPVHKYVENTNYPGKIIEQGDLLEM